MNLVKIQMLTTGPNKNYKVGQIIEVDEKRAEILIKGKDGKPVKS